MHDHETRKRPIGVFDSDVGGLTGLKVLREVLPHEDLIYLGDTARLPYGTKSPLSICRYACQAMTHLQNYGIKLLVVACNTASAVVLEAMRQQIHPLPVIGVVEPGAMAAVATGIVTRYLQPLVETSYQPACVILGCTHLPLLREAIAGVVANGTVIVDSASTTAEFAMQTLADAGLANAGSAAGVLRLLATDGATRFSRVGGRFLGERLATSDIELVDL